MAPEPSDSEAGAWRLRTVSAAETEERGAGAGAAARPGDAFLLQGPVGAGKTVLAAGILRGLGVAGPYPSPTFTLVRSYAGRVPVHHVDLYRLGQTAADEDLGWDDLLDGSAVLVVEWAQYLGPLTPADGVRVDIEPLGPEARRLAWRALGPGGLRLLRAARAAARRGDGPAGPP